ncbi:small ribosomal subunit protein mS40 [Euwallacea fornicatus]|uniref:small ribosomal subunit protein mS40 n=1 Tax=Euwallacea fornicatus TaxID=995702 RepID=UPI00338E2A0A
MFSRTLMLNNVLSNLFRRRPLSLTSIYSQEDTESSRVETRELTNDRTQVIPVETSIRYLKSAAFKQTYGDEPVWIPYRRNHKGALPPKKTRKTCIRGGKISTGSPCPICRDEYLVLHEENIELLKHFISPHTGGILWYNKTGLCRKRQEQLEICIRRAYDKGLLTYDVPFRKYDYSQYHPKKLQ